MAQKRQRSAPGKRSAERAPQEWQARGSPQLAFPVVGIGASAGGIEAFTRLLRALPTDTGMAFVLVQHLDPSHQSMLTEILGRATRMAVAEIPGRVAPEPNHVYVIPPGSDLVIAEGKLEVSPRQETRGQHRPIDRFLRSLAEDQGHKAIGVILSGSATDGTLGCSEIKAAGGITFAQDATAQHDSMPRSAIAAGCVDFVLSPEDIARELVRIARHPYVAPEGEASQDLLLPQVDIGEILELLHRRHGVDFSHYKRNTLHRRITRRMVLHRVDGMADYLRIVEQTPEELEALYQDILINVTSFFRNPEAYDALKGHAFPRLLEGRSRHDPLRLWVLGCSTGEEAYSLAIALTEYMEDTQRQIPLQLFATDLNGAGIERARAGMYARNITQDVSPDRLRRFFVETEGSYRIRKSIRDACVFARHNVLTEPPFSRIDLVSCRNLLIYLGQEMQQRVIPILHYALQPKGVLWLGNSETIGSYRDLFELEETRHKIYRKKPSTTRLAIAPVVQGFRRDPHPEPGAAPGGRDTTIVGLEVQKEADRLLLAKYAPASVVVGADFEILQFRGNTGLYLAPAPGRASLNVMKMLREGLLVAVRAALHKAKKDEVPVRKEGLRVKTNGSYEDINIEVVPVQASSGNRCFLILFEDAAARRAGRASEKAKESTTRARASEERERAGHESDRLKQELAATREYLQSVIEQQEAANEELQSANEEVQSANEELQSINEELETSKEEVQSSNEELATVNEELNHRNTELALINNDLVNLLSSVQMAIVIVGPNLRIRRFTPAAERMLNLIPADVGRPIKDLNLNLSIADFERKLEEVIDTVAPKDFEVLDKGGRWHSLRLRPYRTLDNKIDGAVIVLVDIDDLKRNEERLSRHAQMLEQAHEPMLIWELDGGIVYWNKAAEAVYGYAAAEALGRKTRELLSVKDGDAIKESLRSEGGWTGALAPVRKDGGRVDASIRMVLVRESDGRSFVLETHRVNGG
jgi:two-component system CheB/CheR fusion protein